MVMSKANKVSVGSVMTESRLAMKPVLVHNVWLIPECVYDPVKDIAPVDQFGFVELHDAYVNSTIPGDLAVSEEAYNGVDDPASLQGRSADVFESIRKASVVKSAEAAAAAAGDPSNGGSPSSAAGE